MRTPNGHDKQSPVGILTELAVEGTSSLVETQRTLLNLAKQESDIILNGVKERVGGFAPAVAMTDLVRRSVDTLVGMQQELLTTTSKQTLQWLESEKAGKSDRAARLAEFAREGVETFTRAQSKFLEVVAQEAAKATSGEPEHEARIDEKTELTQLAREAGNAFIEAQKRLLDVVGQQMNVNMDATTRTLEMISPSQLMPMARGTGESVKKFVAAETSLIELLVRPRKTAAGDRPAPRRSASRTARPRKAVPV